MSSVHKVTTSLSIECAMNTSFMRPSGKVCLDALTCHPSSGCGEFLGRCGQNPPPHLQYFFGRIHLHRDLVLFRHTERRVVDVGANSVLLCCHSCLGTIRCSVRAASSATAGRKKSLFCLFCILNLLRSNGF